MRAALLGLCLDQEHGWTVAWAKRKKTQGPRSYPSVGKVRAGPVGGCPLCAAGGRGTRFGWGGGVVRMGVGVGVRELAQYSALCFIPPMYSCCQKTPLSLQTRRAVPQNANSGNINTSALLLAPQLTQ